MLGFFVVCVHLPMTTTNINQQPITLADEAATQSLAQSLAYAIISVYAVSGVASKRGVTISLRGELGAGKTTFVRSVLRAFGVTGRIKSPTYAICEQYELGNSHEPLKNSLELKAVSSLYCYHFDFYRFTDSESWVSGGFSEYFSGHDIRLVEWEEKVQDGSNGLLFAPDLRIHLSRQAPPQSLAESERALHDARRIASIEAMSTLGQSLLQQLSVAE
jgi:tRNA threonylcarbamoyladenosine biosynthesis protein TsaE